MNFKFLPSHPRVWFLPCRKDWAVPLTDDWFDYILRKHYNFFIGYFLSNLFISNFPSLFKVWAPAFCRSTWNHYFKVSTCILNWGSSCSSEAVRKSCVSNTLSCSGYASVHTGIKDTNSKKFSEAILLICMMWSMLVAKHLCYLLVGHWRAV